MEARLIDPLTALAFTVSENKGVFALLLGSGLSRAAGIPTGWEITLDLIRKVAAATEEPDQPDWESWYEHKFKKPPNYSELLMELGLTADERRSFLHRYVNPTPAEAKSGKKRPTSAHKAIARLVRDGYVRVIITTNFDRLIENAIRDEGIEPTIIRSVDDIKGAVPLVHSQCILLKLHGDYLDARIRNTEHELSKYEAELEAYLEGVLDEFGLIVSGWSGEWDPALRAAIMRTANRRYPMFFTTRSALSARSSELTAHRSAKVLTIKNADSFFEALQQQIALIERAQQPNPRSVALLVEQAKQFIARPEHKVDQSDLLGESLRTALELKRAPDLLRLPDFGTQIARFEAVAEPLTRLLGICGRYGDGAEVDQTIEAITALSTFEVQTGSVPSLELQRYPGMLALYGYGLGAQKAQRFGIVFRLFSLRLDSLGGPPKSVVDDFFLGTWEGQKLPWATLGAPTKSTIPLGRHLETVLKRWTRDYIYDEKDFDFQFALFEALGAITYLTLGYDDDSDIRAAFTNPHPAQNFRFAPHALLGRDPSRRAAVLEFLDQPGIQKLLLAAGFGRSNRSHLAAILENLQRLWSAVGFFV